MELLDKKYRIGVIKCLKVFSNINKNGELITFCCYLRNTKQDLCNKRRRVSSHFQSYEPSIPDIWANQLDDDKRNSYNTQSDAILFPSELYMGDHPWHPLH